jgi:hypothetical protein
VQNLNLRHIFLIHFLIFGDVFGRLALQFEKSTNMTLQFLKKSNKVSKNAKFHADFKSVAKD